ncbi:MAG: hypothetical protein NW237_15850 [Cyanobacteriota bacterium]|nr:hypothetical protein [Cyanobacteriota bacterium]
MLILSPTDVQRHLSMTTEQEKREVIVYRSKQYALKDSFQTLQEATVSCRYWLDRGVFNIITKEPDSIKTWALTEKTAS